jgi:3'-phosphoadenosine 5'-phosphosulfate sulfotransferase (PAPS reductase)/FAD synthetase
MTDPFKIQGPALISFSGGRTSAYMLWRILQAHGGALPDDVHVCFANTGKEREETLRFVQECGGRWNVPITWLEWRPMPDRFATVDFYTADRTGAPFEGLIALRGRLPNPLQRFCSRELKVEPIKAFCRSLGWERWVNVIGLRYDEGRRVRNKLNENDNGSHRWKSAMPLHDGKITRDDVMEFWADQDFDLGLQAYEGNCDLCFMKGTRILHAIIRADPQRAKWWIEQEAAGNRFERDRSYASIADAVERQPVLRLFDSDQEHDAECGTWCESVAA